MKVYEAEGDNFGKTDEMRELEAKTAEIRKQIAAAHEKIAKSAERVKVRKRGTGREEKRTGKKE